MDDLLKFTELLLINLEDIKDENGFAIIPLHPAVTTAKFHEAVQRAARGEANLTPWRDEAY